MCRRGENITHRKDGRWEARFVIGKRPDGTTKFKSVFAKSYADAKARKYRAMNEWFSKHPTAWNNPISPLCSAFIPRWLEDEVLGTVKLSTYQTYCNIAKNQVLPFFSNSCISAITPAVVQEFIFSLELAGLSSSTIKGALRLLSSALNYAQEEGMIRKNPCRKIKVHARKAEQRVFTEEEQRRLKEAADSSNLPALLSLYTGMRLGEICALRWEDLNWQEATVTVRRTAQRVKRNGSSSITVSSPKTRGSYRVIPLPKSLLDLLRERQSRSGSGFIFGDEKKAADPRNVQRHFSRLLKSLEIHGGHFHTLRHSFATRLLTLGTEAKSVSVILGHSTVKTTLDIYVHHGLERLRAAVESLAAVL